MTGKVLGTIWYSWWILSVLAHIWRYTLSQLFEQPALFIVTQFSKLTYVNMFFNIAYYTHALVRLHIGSASNRNNVMLFMIMISCGTCVGLGYWSLFFKNRALIDPVESIGWDFIDGVYIHSAYWLPLIVELLLKPRGLDLKCVPFGEAQKFQWQIIVFYTIWSDV